MQYGRIIGAGLLLLTTGAAHATTLSSPLQLGDLLFVDGTEQNLFQFHGSTQKSKITFSAQKDVNGVALGADGSVYFASGNSSTSDPLQVERFDVGQAAGTVVLGSSAFSGISGAQYIRDVAAASDGTLYTILSTGSSSSSPLYKFTPDGLGGYNAGTLVANVPINIAAGDMANGHLDLTGDGKFLVTASRSDNKVYSINTATGAVQSAGITSPLGEALIDPVAGNKVLYGNTNGTAASLYEIDFDPVTGAFSGSPLALSVNNTSAVVDAMAFDPVTQQFLLSVRDGKTHLLSYSALEAARSGTLLDLTTLPVFLGNGAQNVARDMVYVPIPLPSAAAMGLPLLGGSLLLRRRRA